MSNPRFSVITISFNSISTIERTIQSVLSQTCSDYEYLIVDGASTDGTVDIIRKYEPLFNGRMRWKSEPDKGIYNAMNKGIAASRGDVVAIVNSDDWLEPTSLETVLEEYLKCDDHNILISGDVLFHYEDGATQLFSSSMEKFVYYSKKYRMGLNHPATFVPKIVYEAIGTFDEKYRYYADTDFALRCFKANVKVCFVHKVLSNMADGGASNVMTRKQLKDCIYKFKKHTDSYPEYIYYSALTYVQYVLRRLTPDWVLRFYRRYKENKLSCLKGTKTITE